MSNSKIEQNNMPDLFERDWSSASRQNGAAYYRSEPKYPYAVMLDNDGKIIEPEIMVLPEEYRKKIHEGRIGCPCCGAPLKGTRQKDKTVGSSNKKKSVPARKAFFSSYSLDDHAEDCELASVDDRVRTEAQSRLEFFAAKGKKILYWNLPYGDQMPAFEYEYSSPLIRDGVKRTAKSDPDVKTYEVSSMEDFLKMAKHRDFTDPFWKDVDIYDEEHAIPFYQFFMGSDLPRVLRSAFERAANNRKHAYVAILDIPPLPQGTLEDGPYNIASFGNGRSSFDSARGVFTIEAEPIVFTSNRDLLTSFSVQPIIVSPSNALFNKICKGGKFAIHGLMSVDFLLTRAIANGEKIGPAPSHTFPLMIDAVSEADIVDMTAYLEKLVLPSADVDAANGYVSPELETVQ